MIKMRPIDIQQLYPTSKLIKCQEAESKARSVQCQNPYMSPWLLMNSWFASSMVLPWPMQNQGQASQRTSKGEGSCPGGHLMLEDAVTAHTTPPKVLRARARLTFPRNWIHKGQVQEITGTGRAWKPFKKINAVHWISERGRKHVRVAFSVVTPGPFNTMSCNGLWALAWNRTRKDEKNGQDVACPSIVDAGL